MDCARIKEMLSEYMDGTLDESSRPRVEDHLSTCKACKEEYEALKAMVHELSSLEPVEAPEDFLRQVHERIGRESGLQRFIKALFIP